MTTDAGTATITREAVREIAVEHGWQKYGGCDDPEKVVLADVALPEDDSTHERLVVEVVSVDTKTIRLVRHDHQRDWAIQFDYLVSTHQAREADVHKGYFSYEDQVFEVLDPESNESQAILFAHRLRCAVRNVELVFKNREHKYRLTDREVSRIAHGLAHAQSVLAQDETVKTTAPA